MKKISFYISIFIISWLYSIIFMDFDSDLWARLAAGKAVWETGGVLRHDIFSFTQTKPLWIDHEWGASTIFYAMADHLGDFGLIFLKILLVFGTLFIISKTIELKNKEPNQHLNFLFYLVGFLAMFNGFASMVRCQIFTFFFFALWLYILERVRIKGSKILWLLPIIMLFWANIHGGFVVGLIVLALYTIGEYLNGEKTLKYLITLGCSLLIPFINPYGVDFIKYMLQAATMKRTHIQEWHATPLLGTIKDWFWFKLSLLFLSGSYAFSLRGKGKPFDKTKALILLFTLYAALAHIKHQPLFVIAAMSFLYHDFYSIFETFKEKFAFWEKLNNVKETIVYTLVIGFGTLLMLVNPLVITVPMEKYPVGSIEFIKQNNLSGNVLTTFNWGSYTAWNLYPKGKIAIDGRYEEVYPDEIASLVENFTFVLDKNWYDISKKYPLDILVIDRRFDSYAQIKQNKIWKEIYADKLSSVFIPSNKVKKTYIYPTIYMKLIEKNKYKTDIKF